MLIINTKSYVSFRLVPKSMTLDDLERRYGPYFALFHRIRAHCVKVLFTFAISFPDEFLFEQLCTRDLSATATFLVLF